MIPADISQYHARRKLRDRAQACCCVGLQPLEHVGEGRRRHRAGRRQIVRLPHRAAAVDEEEVRLTCAPLARCVSNNGFTATTSTLAPRAFTAAAISTPGMIAVVSHSWTRPAASALGISGRVIELTRDDDRWLFGAPPP